MSNRQKLRVAMVLFVAVLVARPLTAQSNRNGIVDRRGNFVVVDADLGFPFSAGLAPARRAPFGKCGFLNKAGKWAIKPQFTLAGPFSEGLAMVTTSDGKVGFIDPSGRLAIKPSFDEVGFSAATSVYFSSGLCPVKSNDKWGYVDKTGKMAIAPEFYSHSPFREGMAAVLTGIGRFGPHGETAGQWGYINFGYINKAGTFVVSPSFSFAGPFLNGRAEVFAGRKTSIINQSGVIVVEDLEMLGDRSTSSDALCGEELDRNTLAPVRSFVDGRAPFSRAGKWGYIDQMGRVAIPPRFEDARLFSEGLAAVKMGGKWGFIDPAGAFIIQPTFDIPGDFADGIALVAK